MENLQKKVDLLISYVIAEDKETRERALEELMAFKITPSENASIDVRGEIEATLRHIGVPCSILGYYDLIEALVLVLDDPSYVEDITKRLYPDVARIRGGHRSASRVERAMRHAIENAWDRGDFETLQELFGNTVSPLKGKPTNSEFIAQVAVHLRRRLGIKM